MRFGDDWTGVFIRGDQAFFFALSLREVLENPSEMDFIRRKALESIAALLESSNEQGAIEDRQNMVPFDEARRP
jgi:hypothetical protein